MQPSKPPLSAIEQRMSEYEEACILMCKISQASSVADWTQDELKLHMDMRERLAVLLQRMIERRTERELREGPYQPPPEKRVVTEDSEL